MKPYDWAKLIKQHFGFFLIYLTSVFISIIIIIIVVVVVTVIIIIIITIIINFIKNLKETGLSSKK